MENVICGLFYTKDREIYINPDLLWHENFKKLSSGAKVALIYMMNKVIDSEGFEDTGIFECSIGYLSESAHMSKSTAISSFKQLQYYGFIQKENAQNKSSATNKWRFSDKWTVEQPTVKKEKTYTVYVHIFPNNKKYYGFTGLKPEKRWAKGLGYKINKKMFKEIQQVGWDNIKHLEILKTTDIIDALCYEYAYIIKDQTYLDGKGYNQEKADIEHFKKHLRNHKGGNYQQNLNRLGEILKEIFNRGIY